jgi:hypothetical protein
VGDNTATTATAVLQCDHVSINGGPCYKCGQQMPWVPYAPYVPYQYQPAQLMGWVCPKCNSGVSPFTTKCPCSQAYSFGPYAGGAGITVTPNGNGDANFL